MGDAHESYTRSGSTKWEYRKCKMSPPPAGDSPRSEAKRSTKALRRRSMYKPLTITVRYVAGPQCSWLITYRGKVWRFAGYLELHDVLSSLSSGSWDRMVEQRLED